MRASFSSFTFTFPFSFSFSCELHGFWCQVAELNVRDDTLLGFLFLLVEDVGKIPTICHSCPETSEAILLLPAIGFVIKVLTFFLLYFLERV